MTGPIYMACKAKNRLLKSNFVSLLYMGASPWWCDQNGFWHGIIKHSNLAVILIYSLLNRFCDLIYPWGDFGYPHQNILTNPVLLRKPYQKGLYNLVVWKWLLQTKFDTRWFQNRLIMDPLSPKGFQVACMRSPRTGWVRNRSNRDPKYSK